MAKIEDKSFYKRKHPIDEKDMMIDSDDSLSPNKRSKNENDSQFEKLMDHFAAMSFSEDIEEKCPICPEILPLKDFASHVYKCLEILDRIEAQIQIEKDEKLAFKLLQDEVDEYDKNSLFDIQNPFSTNVDFQPIQSNEISLNSAHNIALSDMKTTNQKSKESCFVLPDINLNANHLTAFAQELVKEKAKGGLGDYQNLLKSFQSLGFTEDNLKKTLENLEKTAEEDSLSSSNPNLDINFNESSLSSTNTNPSISSSTSSNPNLDINFNESSLSSTNTNPSISTSSNSNLDVNFSNESFL